MTDLIRGFTSSLLHLDASLVQYTGWLALICLPRTEKIFEKKLDKLLAGFELTEQLNWALVSWIEKYKHKQLATTPEIIIKCFNASGS